MTAIKPRTARVVIYQGDDLARLAELRDAATSAEVSMRVAERRAKDASIGPPATLDEVPGEQAALVVARERYDEAIAEHDAFASEAESRGVSVVMHAQPRKKWRDLMNAHAPRPDVEQDVPLGVNIETLPDALLPMSICRDPACPHEQRSTIEGDTVEFLESLSDQDYYDRLFLTAFALNRGSAAADPTLRLGSALSQTSAATSN